VARYGKEYKDRVVARLLPPESALVEQVSAEVGVSASTLEGWLADALESASGGGEPARRV
jgi:transposase